MKIRNKFSTLNIMEMNEHEYYFEELFYQENLNFIKNVIKNNRGIKFKRPAVNKKYADKWFMIVSPSFKKGYRYRLTLFDHLGIFGHTDFKNIDDLAKKIIEEIPDEQQYIVPLEVI